MRLVWCENYECCFTSSCEMRSPQIAFVPVCVCSVSVCLSLCICLFPLIAHSSYRSFLYSLSRLLSFVWCMCFSIYLFIAGGWGAEEIPLNQHLQHGKMKDSTETQIK